ncbi:hybrid sensor histidine kinase/response regulator [Luteimonas huabeiensis]|uniref:hybrid sensor histidine kinase/response regulator n=1 Tax=Luteimonas huabeiensis TaxID=1244513 RepID=UPI00046381AE|nr:ATP-binding protein [Luteimonas huabeiensis]
MSARQEAARLRALVDAAPAVLWITEADGHCSFVADGWHALTGQAVDEALGHGWLEALHPDDRPRVRAEFALAHQRQSAFELEYRVHGDGGRHCWVAHAGKPRHDASGAFAGFAGSVFDIDERHRSAEKYRALFESIDQGFCILQMLFDESGAPADYRILEVNPSYARHTGLLDAEGRTVRELVPDLEPHWFDIYGRVASSGVATRFVEGSAAMGRWFDVYAFPVGDVADRQIAVLFSDITERREQEQALLDADRRKDEFLATLAHELRNPLAPIRTSLYVLRLEPHPNSTRRMLDILMRQVDQLTRLVDDLMEVSRITRGRIELRPVDVRLDLVIRNAMETAQPNYTQAGQRLELDLPAEPVWLYADPVRLAQVFTNLLNNASRYSRPDGAVRLQARVEDGEAVITVRDQGMGIAPEHLQSIFELFTQIDRARNADARGLGIGLALVKSLVQMHGGRIGARSDGPGLGAEFEVRLPLQGRAAAEPPPPEPGPERAFAGLRVLVADDNRDAAESLGEWLSAFGAETVVVHDGLSALKMTQQRQPHVALLDLGMPELSGLEVARQLRRSRQQDNLRLIAITGWGQAQDRTDTQAAGFDHHMTKPPDIVQLRRLLLDVRRELLGPRDATAHAPAVEQ